MEKILPPEILVSIFTNYLPLKDVAAVYLTCTYWRDIINNFNLWNVFWEHAYKHVPRYLSKALLPLKDSKFNGKEGREPTIRLINIIYNRFGEISEMRTFIRKCVAILKTHNSHIEIAVKEINTENILRLQKISVRIDNMFDPKNDELYRKFRTMDLIIISLDRYYQCHLHQIKCIESLVFSYPMSLHNAIKEKLLMEFFQTYHVRQVFFIPRVVLLCENLQNILNAVVVFSTSRSTEIAVVLNQIVPVDRWREVPIGGWTVSQYLHTLLQPNIHENNVEIDMDSLENVKVKKFCFLKTFTASDEINMSKLENKVTKLNLIQSQNNGEYIIQNMNITLKDRYYLAPERMYEDLNLCGIIQELLTGLDDELVQECLKNVILIGGNATLKNFEIRVTLDLKQIFPQFEESIKVEINKNNRYAYEFENTSHLRGAITVYEPGRKCRISMKNYIRNNVIP